MDAIGKGLKFIPSTAPPPSTVVLNSLNSFFRKIALKEYFKDRFVAHDSTTTFVPEFHVANPEWKPPIANNLAAYMAGTSKLVMNRFKKTTALLSFKKPSFVSELQNLKHDKQLRVIATDKNLGVALIKQHDYREMCLEHLNDASTYDKTNDTLDSIRDRTEEELSTLLSSGIAAFKHIKGIDKFLGREYLQSCSIPYFHCLAKVHKTPLKGRPIAGAVNWITTPISKLLSYSLRPDVQGMQHVLRDSKQFIQQCEYIPLEESDLIVTLDIVSLYPSMDQPRTIQAVQAIANDNHEIQNWNVEATDFILRNSFVEFDSNTYRQVKGMPMGTNAAVELANIYVNHWIEQTSSFKRWKQRCMKLWKRYIDDCFMIWKGTRNELDLFLAELNSLDSNIKFTSSISWQSGIFLDVEAFRSTDNQLRFRAFQKPLNKYLYIPFDSNHPVSVKRAFIKGELIRYVRNCSFKEDYDNLKSKFRVRLEVRGYPHWFFDQSGKDVHFRDRNKWLQSVSQNNAESKLILTLPYHPLFNHIGLRDVLTCYWDFLDISNTHQPLIAFTKQKNLADYVLASKFCTTETVD